MINQAQAYSIVILYYAIQIKIQVWQLVADKSWLLSLRIPRRIYLFMQVCFIAFEILNIKFEKLGNRNQMERSKNMKIILFVLLELIRNDSRVREQYQDVGGDKWNTMEDSVSKIDICRQPF